jgi:transposase
MLGSIRRPEEEEVFGVQDWAEVHRLNRQGVAKRAIARRLGMSHTTVHRLLGLAEPPRYERRRISSLLDPFAPQIAAMLDTDPKVPATVVLQHLRRDGYAGGVTILKEHLARMRPQFLAARTFQRTSYLPGEISQIDWWHTGAQVPVGKGATREAFGLVATLPASAAHAAVFTFGRTIGDLLPAALGCFQRLGGVPDTVVCDNDSAIVACRRGGTAILHDEVASFFGQLGTTVVPLRPSDPQAKGQVERTNGYLDRSFLSLRSFTDIGDLQAQHDDWATNVAYRRHHRRVGAIVHDAWRVERGFLRALPNPAPDTTRHMEARVTRDGFCRIGDVDYSVPPGLSGRRAQVRSSPTEVVVHLEGREIARHRRSYVPADVVIAPQHARALRLAREARDRLQGGDVEVPTIDLSRYDRLLGVGSAGPSVDPPSENGSQALLVAGFSTRVLG